MIVIIGISHMEKLDNQLEKIIYDFKPEAICVELDETGLKLLTNQMTEEQIKSYYSNMPFTFKMLSMFKETSQIQSSVDRMWDSKLVYKISQDLGFKIIPMDIDKKQLYLDLERDIKFSERFRILCSVLKYLIFSHSKSDESNDYEKRFPTLKKYLIDKRNEHMLEEIKKNASVFKKIIVLVGDYHLEGFRKLDVKDELKIIDLKTLRSLA